MPSRYTTDLTLTLSVADPGLPRASTNSRGVAPTYYFAKFPLKLHENEKKKLDGEVRAPFGSATACGVDNFVQM